MIDTIKFLVPIEDLSILIELAKTSTQTKKQNHEKKEVMFNIYTKDINIGSFSRTISIKISTSTPSGLFIEFSVPKYLKGNNVEMIHAYELNSVIEVFYKELLEVINIEIPHYSLWQIYRLDLCYNWIFKDLDEAKLVISFIQKIDFPRKKKHIYDTSVMHVGKAYTIKFYLKGPEFRKHDLKKVLDYFTPEKVQLLSELSSKILRYEIGIRKKQLETIFDKKKVFLDDICDDTKILEILNFYLNDKIFKYINIKNKSDLTIEELLFSKFTKIKATRLLQFYRDYYLEDGTIKQHIKNGGLSRTTIYRYKTDLLNAGLNFGLEEFKDSELLVNLTIPSDKSVFNLEDYIIAGKDKKCYD